MKFTATVLSMFVLSASAVEKKPDLVPCDPTKIHYKLFDDLKCANFDKEMTKEHGTVPKKMYPLFSGKCEVLTEHKDISVKVLCDVNGIYQWAFKG